METGRIVLRTVVPGDHGLTGEPQSPIRRAAHGSRGFNSKPYRSRRINPARLRGFAIARHVMNSISARDTLLTVLTMSSAFLIEVALFAWIGMF